jgi:hypothetical protein
MRFFAAYSSLSTCNGFWPRILKLAAQPVAVANTAVPASATAVANHSTCRGLVMDGLLRGMQ